MNPDQQPLPLFNLPKIFDALLKIGMGSVLTGLIPLGFGLGAVLAFFVSETAAAKSAVLNAAPVNYGGCFLLMTIGVTLILIGSYNPFLTKD